VFVHRYPICSSEINAECFSAINLSYIAVKYCIVIVVL